MYFNFMAAVTICSDFGAQENKVCHCFPIYLPWLPNPFPFPIEVPGPSVFPSGEPGVSGDFWGSQEGCQGPSRDEKSESSLWGMGMFH